MDLNSKRLARAVGGNDGNGAGDGDGLPELIARLTPANQHLIGGFLTIAGVPPIHINPAALEFRQVLRDKRR